MLGPIDDFLYYRERGISVFPTEFAGKQPKPGFLWKEFQRRIAEIDEICEWCRIRCGIALVMGQISGLLAVDADSKSALEFMDTLPLSLCGTRSARGEHRFYRLPEGLIIGNRARLRGMKLDIRAEGGYVLAAPSLHPSGFKYERLGDWSKIRECPEFDPSWLESAKVPNSGTLQTSIVTSSPTHSDKLRRAHAYAAKVPGAISGQSGHTQTFALACKLVRLFDLSEKEVLDVLIRWNPKCEPPWLDAELRHKAADAIRYANREISQTQQETRNAMLNVTNPREGTCVICREKKDGGDAEFADKRFPGPVFLCWTDMKNQLMPPKPKKEKKA